MIRDGDGVRLNSGGPTMLVVRATPTSATCFHVGGDGTSQTIVFPAVCLRVVWRARHRYAS